MAGELAVRADYVLQMNRTVNDIQAERSIILQVMEKCMEKDKDYGIIPGCGKPSLWKAGAEKIRARFGIVIEDPITEDLSTEDERRFRVTIRATHGGILIGAHSAECSSSEDKYKWKKAVCDDEWNETPENMRREKWKAGYKGAKPYKVKQIRTKIADVSNTILAMAIKRGSVGVTLQVTAASDIFTLDIENLEDLINNGGDPEENHTEPKPTTEAPKTTEEAKKEPAKSDVTVIPEITGTITKVSPRPFNSKVKGKDGKMETVKKPHTFYIVKNDELGEIEIQTWAEPVASLKDGVKFVAKNVTVGEYNKQTTYSAESIDINIEM